MQCKLYIQYGECGEKLKNPQGYDASVNISTDGNAEARIIINGDYSHILII